MRRSQCRYAEAGPPPVRPVILLHGWPTTSTPLSMSRPAGIGRLPGHVPYGRVTARRAFVPAKRSAMATVGDRCHTSPDGWLKIDRARSPGSIGRADGRHHRGLWPNAARPSFRKRHLIGSQEAGKMPLRQRPNCMVVPILFRHRARPGRLREIPHDFAKLILADASRSGTSMLPRSIAQLRPSTTPIIRHRGP